MISLIKKILGFFNAEFWKNVARGFLVAESPCCNKPMSSVFDMEFDRLVYECSKCKKEWI